MKWRAIDSVLVFITRAQSGGIFTAFVLASAAQEVHLQVKAADIHPQGSTVVQGCKVFLVASGPVLIIKDTLPF